jgi:hypothetical protein
MMVFYAGLGVIWVVCCILACFWIKGATQDAPDWLEEEEFQRAKLAMEKEAETNELKRILGIGPYFNSEDDNDPAFS